MTDEKKNMVIFFVILPVLRFYRKIEQFTSEKKKVAQIGLKHLDFNI